MKFLSLRNIFIVLFIFLFIYFNKFQFNTQTTITQPNALMKNPIYDLNYASGLIKADLQTYGYLSTKTQLLILNSIEKTSIEFNLPQGLLHAIFRVESEYKFWVDHPPVKVTKIIKGKKVKIITYARGLGGVMWFYWSKKLKENNIANKSSDLYLPEINIRASGFILRDIINSGERIGQKNIMNYIQKRYYGANSKSYMSKMIKVTSDLWMDRIAKQIKTQRSLIDTSIIKDTLFN